jgi:cobalt/nickel transport system ATP-binding protein
MHIIIQNLSYHYPDGQKALSDVSLTISKGERIALVGPNGAGKSTLLLHLNGILKGIGEIAIDGVILSDETLPIIRRKVGIIFQDPNDQLFCPTVRDDVAFGPEHFGLTHDKIDHVVTTALNHVAMNHKAHRPAHHLSLGERRRVAIAAVLACEPEILVFDEPIAMLDPRRQREMTSFIRETQKTVIIATHDPQFALTTTTRCILMNSGKIVADGPSKEILGNGQLLAQYGL